MANQPSPPLFLADSFYRWRSKRLKAAVSVPANGHYWLFSVNGQRGKIGQISVNLADQTSLKLVLAVANRRILDHTPANIEDTGAGDLALEIPNAQSSILCTTKSAASNYAISFMGHLINLGFDRKADCWVQNDTGTAVNIQAAYVLWAILGRSQF
jgi:hypothetical protein